MRLLPIACVLAAASAAADESRPPANPDQQLKQEWEARFRAADEDGTRSLTRAEAEAGLPKVLYRRFDEIDLDASGTITPEELWAMHEREVAERERRRAERVGGPPR